jgi:diguanylate cyclase (GGDEF)-like protein
VSSDLNPTTRIYIGALCLAATGAMVFLLASSNVRPSPADLALAVALAAVLNVAHRHPLPFAAHAQLVLDTAIILAAVLLLDPRLAVLSAGLGPLLANLPRRDPWPQSYFNAAQSAIQAAAGSVALAVGGFWHRDDPFARPDFLIPVILAGAAMFVVNTTSVAAIVAFQTNRPAWAALPEVAAHDRTEAAAHLAQLGLGLLAAVVADAHTWALILLVLPGAVVFSSLGHHVRLRLRAEARLVHLAYHDPLTDLANRTRLIEDLAEALRGPAPLALLFLDLDDFKAVNDTLGHETGDQLLVEVAARLRSCAPEDATVARHGGDEFTILLPDPTGPAEPTRVAARMLAALATPADLGPRQVTIPASIGIVRRRAEHRTPADLLRDADAALYRAKDDGRGRIAVFSPDPSDPSAGRTADPSSERRRQRTGETARVWSSISAPLAMPAQPVADLAQPRYPAVPDATADVLAR